MRGGQRGHRVHNGQIVRRDCCWGRRGRCGGWNGMGRTLFVMFGVVVEVVD
jgi:hypothetical protein